LASFELEFSGKSDIGMRRANNQDSILLNAKNKIFAVADGMGGHSGGEVASSLAVKTLEKIFPEIKAPGIAERISETIRICNQVIYEQSQADPKLRGMGTTLSAAILDEDSVHIGQVGDSRVYMYRNGELFQVTEDHSQVYELLKAGLISETNIGTFQKNVITRSVGYEPEVQVDLFSRKLKKGDRYMICSDGLSGMVSNEQIAQIMQNFSVEEAVNNLVELANLQGGEDNVSVIIFEVK
jgi:serine/threonine protein phosphatase PrpC